MKAYSDSETGNALEQVKQSRVGPRRFRWRRVALWTAIIGPGLMVMLADTDAGSIITAAQSRAEWRYAMILPQILLIPILYRPSRQRTPRGRAMGVNAVLLRC